MSGGPPTTRCLACGRGMKLLPLVSNLMCPDCTDAAKRRKTEGKFLGRANWPKWKPKEEAVEQTYWNGEPCEARRVRVIVADVPNAPPLSWWRGLEGTERAAVEVNYGGQVFYLDDDDAPEDAEERRREAMKALPQSERRRMRALLNAVGPQPRGRAGDGWAKVTKGRGSPQYGHRSLPVERVVEEVAP